MRKSVGMALGMIFLGAFTACDNNPLKDDRDKGLFMYTNPSFATIVVGGTVKVRANVMNQYSAPTGDAVTATQCNARLSAVADTSRTDLEQPERFTVTGLAIGTSCLIVTGGGITDTVGFLVGPAAVDIVADTNMVSGATQSVAILFKNTAGGNISGLTIGDVTFVSRAPTIAFYDAATQTIQGRAPGSTFLVATLNSGKGAIVVDSIKVNVTTSTFNGTITPASVNRGALATLNAGSIPFDANTTVTLNGAAATIISNTPTAFTVVVPASVSGTTATFVISNLGPNEVTATAVAPLGPLATFSGTTPATIAQGGLITISGGTTPFDADTKVVINGDTALIITNTPGALTFVAPAPAGANATVVITNIGPNQLASQFTVPFAAEAGEPDSFGAPRPLPFGTTVYGSLTAADTKDFFSYTPTVTGPVTVTAQWNGPSVASNDVDIEVYRANGTTFTGNFGCATGAKPENCVMTLTAGTTYIFEVVRYEGTFTQAYSLFVR
ncbi:MAG: hypothetical protein ABIS27_06985 [Longimicrobiales bacterium]